MARKKTAIQKNLLSDSDLLIFNQHKKVSGTKTPNYYVKKKGDFDFVDEAYMRAVLNENFPLWSWEVKRYEFIGDKVIIVHGRLTVVDNGQPRFYDSVAAHRVAVKRTAGEYVDISNDLKSANTDAWKVACNRLCNIADDVYRKAVLSDAQLDTIEGMLGDCDVSTRRKVIGAIADKEINPTNFDKTMERLNTMKKQEIKND